MTYIMGCWEMGLLTFKMGSKRLKDFLNCGSEWLAKKFPGGSLGFISKITEVEKCLRKIFSHDRKVNFSMADLLKLRNEFE